MDLDFSQSLKIDPASEQLRELLADIYCDFLGHVEKKCQWGVAFKVGRTNRDMDVGGVGDHATAEELAQIVFTQLFAVFKRKTLSFESKAHLTKYINNRTGWVLMRHFRQVARNPVPLDIVGRGSKEFSEDQDWAVKDPDAVDPLTSALVNEREEIIREHLPALTPAEKRALEDHLLGTFKKPHGSERSPDEKRAEARHRKNLERARKHLEKLLGKDDIVVKTSRRKQAAL